MKNQITQTELKGLFDYREDGNLIRKNACQGNGNYAGRVVGTTPDGTRLNRYSATKIHGKHYCVHKLIYLWHIGEWPEQLDHINRDTSDNRIENLRLADSFQNMRNRNLFANNTSGCKGVSWNKHAKKWYTWISVAGKIKCLGYFKDFELAELVAVEAREKYYGGFAN